MSPQLTASPDPDTGHSGDYSRPNSSLSLTTKDSTKLLASTVGLQPRWTMYSSILVCLLHAIQGGWVNGQMNSSTFNRDEDCAATRIAEGTCVMFPGHTQLEWTVGVNAWLVGAFIGSIGIGKFAYGYGTKNVLYGNCIVMAAGAIVQASAFSIWQFTAGRFISGLATGITSGVSATYLSEISPPNLRSAFTTSFQFTVNFFVFVVSLTFFFADTYTGWRYISAFPTLLAVLFLALAPKFMVKSPAWLLLHDRYDEAERELTRLYGAENVPTAMAWIESQHNKKAAMNNESSEEVDGETGKRKAPSIWAPEYRVQFLTAMGLVLGRQLTGIQIVSFYSSDVFTDAGIKDDRIGVSVVNLVSAVPILMAGLFSIRFGNKRMLLAGVAGMGLSAVGMTISLLTDAAVLSVVFMSTYAFSFGIGLAPFVWAIASDIFPDAIRPQGMAFSMANQRVSDLIVSVAYPYLATSIGDFRYMPFITCTVVAFIFIVACVPETGNRTHAQIQEYFTRSK